MVSGGPGAIALTAEFGPLLQAGGVFLTPFLETAKEVLMAEHQRRMSSQEDSTSEALYFDPISQQESM